MKLAQRKQYANDTNVFGGDRISGEALLVERRHDIACQRVASLGAGTAVCQVRPREVVGHLGLDDVLLKTATTLDVQAASHVRDDVILHHRAPYDTINVRPKADEYSLLYSLLHGAKKQRVMKTTKKQTRWRFLATFLRPVLKRAACSTFQTCILNSH